MFTIQSTDLAARVSQCFGLFVGGDVVTLLPQGTIAIGKDIREGRGGDDHYLLVHPSGEATHYYRPFGGQATISQFLFPPDTIERARTMISVGAYHSATP